MNIQIGHLKALLFQLLQGMQHRVVLELGGDDVLFALALTNGRGGEQGLVVGLAAAAGEDDLPGLAVQNLRDGPAALGQLHGGQLAGGVQAGGVCVVVFNHAEHDLGGVAAHLCGGRIIGVDIAHLYSS